MKNSAILAFIITVLLTGCATMNDPTLAFGVERAGGGVYTASAMGFTDPTKSAVKQCQMDGKRLSILTSTTERGLVSGDSYAKLVFRCE